MYSFFDLLFQPANQTTGLLLRIVASAAILVLAFIIALIFFFIYSRQKQNRLVNEQKLMQEEFEKQLMRSQIEVQEDSFQSLGKELHDNVGQLLGTTRMLIGVAKRQLLSVPAPLNSAEDALVEAIREIRSLSKTLNREWLQQFSFAENLAAEAVRINTSGMVHVDIRNSAGQLAWSSEQQIMLFRIVQEALHNAMKHAAARNIQILIALDTPHSPTLSISIKDDGHGFDTMGVNNGVGMLNMKHRINLLQGTIDWSSHHGGTTVSIKLPTQTFVS